MYFCQSLFFFLSIFMFASGRLISPFRPLLFAFLLCAHVAHFRCFYVRQWNVKFVGTDAFCVFCSLCRR